MEAVSRKKEYDVFLSHSSSDIAQVEQVASQLVEAGLKPFLDKWHLVPGQAWQEALEQALDNSKCCAVFLGPAGVGPWENEELRVALDARIRDEQYRVIPVLLPSTRPEIRSGLPSFLRRLTWVDLRAGIENREGLRRLIAGIRGEQPGPSERDEISSPELTISISDYYKPDVTALTRDAFALAQEFVIPATTTVKFSNPDYTKLKECVRHQSQTAQEAQIVADQLGAVHKADVMIARAERWGASVLHEMSRRSGINAAIECCRRFTELRLCEIVSLLGRYQLAEGAVFSGFEALDLGNEETLVEFILGKDTFVEIELAETGPHYSGKEYATVYLPLRRIENDGNGSLIANLWDEAEYIPSGVWEAYVIPQCAANNASGRQTIMPWARKGFSYVTEGAVWRSGERVEYTPERLGSVTFIIPK